MEQGQKNLGAVPGPQREVERYEKGESFQIYQDDVDMDAAEYGEESFGSKGQGLGMMREKSECRGQGNMTRSRVSEDEEVMTGSGLR